MASTTATTTTTTTTNIIKAIFDNIIDYLLNLACISFTLKLLAHLSDTYLSHYWVTSRIFS